MKQQQAGRAQLASDLEANKQATVHTCKHCGRNFDKSREGWFHKHESDCPGPVKKVDVQVGASNLIGLLTSAHAEYAEKQGSTVTFTVQSRALLDAELDLQLVDGDLTVMAVRPTCMRANVHALAAPGSVLTEAVHVPTTPAAAQPQSTAHERTPAPAGPARRLSPTDLHEVGFSCTSDPATTASPSQSTWLGDHDSAEKALQTTPGGGGIPTRRVEQE
jgi:hypothetical protein